MTKSTDSSKTSVLEQRSKMHACLCMLVIVSVFISMASTTEGNSLDVVKSIRVHIPTYYEQSTPKSDEGKRSKRSISSTDRTNIVNKMNSLRSSVGASNMNYLTYSNSLETEAANWTNHCDFDADIYGKSEGYVVTHASEHPPDHVSDLATAFNSMDFYYGLRSICLRNVGAGSSFCLYATVDGEYYADVYLTAYVFSFTSNFNENQQQYTLGKECTTCQSGSYWCYEGLCRDDCSNQCSCFTSCPKCKDWNKGSCTCPSQPYTDAVTLNCSGSAIGVVTYKSASSKPCIASWIVIVLSTLALFGLQ